MLNRRGSARPCVNSNNRNNTRTIKTTTPKYTSTWHFKHSLNPGLASQHNGLEKKHDCHGLGVILKA